MAQAYYQRSISLILLILLGLFSSISDVKAAFSHDPDTAWFTLKTAHFTVHFQEGRELQAKTTATICEQVHIKLTRYFNWFPNKPTNVVILEQTDISNGSATPVPHNTMNLYMTPSDDLASDYQSWLGHLITHEYTHILHIDKAARAPSFFRRMFGRIPTWFLNTFPNAFQPAWVVEGLATYKETNREHGYGRGQSSLFKMFMRIETEQGFKPLSQVNLPIRSWPSGTTRYLYGVYFFNFLHDTYGETKIQQWIDNYSDNFIAFRINGIAKQEFGKDLFALWEDFEVYLKKTFLPVTQGIKKQGIIEGNQITSTANNTGFPQVIQNGDVYYIENDFLRQAQLMVRRKNSETASVVMEMHGSEFDVHATQGILLSELDLIDNVKPYYDLYISNLDGTQKRQITNAGRYKYASWHPTGEKIVAVQQGQYHQSLQLLSKEGDIIKTLWKANDTTLLTHPQWSPSGNLIVAAVWRPDTKWNLEIFDTTTAQWNKLTNTNNIESRPKFNADGTQVHFIADYGHTFNYSTINIESKKIEQLSNVRTGIIAADFSQAENALYYMGAHGLGFDLYRLDLAQHNPLAVTPAPYVPNVKETTTIKISGQTITSNDAISSYNPLPYIVPNYWFPIFVIEEDRIELGLLTSGNDPLYRHLYSLEAAYDFENHWSLGRLEYIYDRFDPTFKISAQRYVTIERDSNEVAQRYINDDEAALELLFPFLKRDRQAVFHLGWVYNSTSDRKRIPGLTSNGTITDELVGIGLSYNSSKSYPLAISSASGSKFRLVAEDYDSVDSIFTGQVYQIDWRYYFSLTGKHVLASRLMLGWGNEAPKPFRLGDHSGGFAFAPPAASIIVPTGQFFNRRNYALRGYKNTVDLTNRRLLLAESEWRFPIDTIERGFSSPPFGINRIHGRAFYNLGETTAGHFNSSNLRHSIGTEMILEVSLFYGLIPFNVRIGIAHGFNEGGDTELYATLGNTF